MVKGQVNNHLQKRWISQTDKHVEIPSIRFPLSFQTPYFLVEFLPNFSIRLEIVISIHSHKNITTSVLNEKVSLEFA